MIEITKRVYEFVWDLPRHDYRIKRRELKPSGIYFFFERGEKVDLDGIVGDRIVRIGSHRVDGRLPGRIREHYGKVRTLGGDKNATVFRKHLGAAMMNREIPPDPRLSSWLKKGTRGFDDVEERVSRRLRDDFTFTFVPVADQVARIAAEKALIALLAQHRVGKPSCDWLGNSAIDPVVRRSGLWNVDDVDSRPLTSEQYDQLGMR